MREEVEVLYWVAVIILWYMRYNKFWMWCCDFNKSTLMSCVKGEKNDGWYEVIQVNGATGTYLLHFNNNDEQNIYVVG